MESKFTVFLPNTIKTSVIFNKIKDFGGNSCFPLTKFVPFPPDCAKTLTSAVPKTLGLRMLGLPCLSLQGTIDVYYDLGSAALIGRHGLSGLYHYYCPSCFLVQPSTTTRSYASARSSSFHTAFTLSSVTSVMFKLLAVILAPLVLVTRIAAFLAVLKVQSEIFRLPCTRSLSSIY